MHKFSKEKWSACTVQVIHSSINQEENTPCCIYVSAGFTTAGITIKQSRCSDHAARKARAKWGTTKYQYQKKNRTKKDHGKSRLYFLEIQTK
jgi:hypothetical protein